MKTQFPEPQAASPSTKKKLSFLTLGTVGVSVLFHFALLLLVGGAVIIQVAIPKSTFVGATVEEIPTDQAEAPTDEPAADAPESPPSDLPQQPTPSPTEFGPMPDTIMTPSLSPNQAVIMSASTPGALSTTVTSGSAPSSNTSTPIKPGAIHTMTSLFGSKVMDKGALTGYLYDLKQEPNQKPTSMVGPKDETGSSNNPANQEYRKVLGTFLKIWNAGILEKFYKAPDAMSTYQVFLPRMQADQAPKAFDVDKFVKPRRWVILYKGTVTAPVSTTFRFVGTADDILVVRFDRKIVLDGSLGKVSDWDNNRKETVGTVSRGNQTPLYAGDWIKIEAGKSYPIEILTGEQPGGVFYSLLYVQEKDKTYQPRPNNNGLILPLFQTAPTKIPSLPPEDDAPTTKEAFVFGSAE